MKKNKKKKNFPHRIRPECGLCGSKTNLTRTECCGQWICDDEDQYRPFSFARNSCYRNHSRYTLCGSHYSEGHTGDWKTCPKCKESLSDKLEMYVWYGTNEYNFETLPNPPAFEPTYCSQCGQRINLGEDGYTTRGDTYTCEKCDSETANLLTKFAPTGNEDLFSDFDEDQDEEDAALDEMVRPQRLGFEALDDIDPDVYPRFKEMCRLVARFCAGHQAYEFALLCMDMVASLCIQFPDFVSKGNPEGLACGIVHALGMVNFLSDPSSKPCIKPSEIYSFFGISQGTMQSKSRQIRDLFGIYDMDLVWSLPDMLMKNPMLWMVPINGFIVDIRDASPKIQRQAVDEGLIPMLPAELEKKVKEYKKQIQKVLQIYGLTIPEVKPPDEKTHKSNIKIVDYQLPAESPQETPLFDPSENG